MRALRLFVLLVLIGAFSASCGVCSGGGVSRLVTPAPTPSDDVEGPDVFWGHVNDTLRSFGRTWREARQNHPNYPTSQESANALSNEFEQSATDYLGVLNQRTPPPGLETQFGALKIKLRALLDDLRASPVDGAAVDAAYNDYVTACQAVQQFADSTNAGVDLECAGPSGPLSDADFFAAIAPAIATMHMQTDDAQSALGARTDATSLNTYLSGLIAAYGNAANKVIDPTAPTSVEAEQQAFSDAANAIVPAAENLQKLTTDPTAAANVSATMTPLRAAVEIACAQLQAAATSAGITTDLGCRSS